MRLKYPIANGAKQARTHLGILIVLFLLMSNSLSVWASETSHLKQQDWPTPPAITCATAILYDVETETILYNKEMDAIRYPASTTKIMTSLLALEKLAPDTVLTIGEEAASEVYFGSTNINCKVGEELTLDQALHAILLASANEVSTQVAVTISGSVEAFAELMNQRARELGCTNTHFHNAHGLPDDQHWTSAHDLALILAACIQNDAFNRILSDVTYEIPPTNLTSSPRSMQQHHVMMLEGEWFYDGVFAGKTGYTDAAGHTLVTACKKNGQTLICVVMGGNNPDYFIETKKLLDYAYENFSLITPVNSHKMPLPMQIILPKEAELSDLTCVDVPLASSASKTPSYTRTYYYGKNPLGSGVIAEEDLNRKSPEEIRAFRIKLIITIVLALLLCASLISYYSIHKRVEDERKFNAEMKRKYRN